MTWLQDVKRPIAVTAVTRIYKPNIYPKVDDDATIILEYKDAPGIIQASWNWSYSIKDFQVYGENRSYYAANANTLFENKNTTDVENIKLTDTYYNNNLVYLKYHPKMIFPLYRTIL
jgi:predicted dehydrogenase